MTASGSASQDVDNPVNSDISNFELIARNIYETSQFAHNRLKKNRFYPNFRRESRDFPGRHVCRISVQRLCAAKWDKAVYWANRTSNGSQHLVGFEIALAIICRNAGFELEPHAHDRNPFHAHIYIRELDKPFEQPEGTMEQIMDSSVRHRLDNMTRQFSFIKIAEIGGLSEVCGCSHCADCLNAS